MKIKDILKDTALMIGRQDLTKYLEDGEEASTQTASAINLLINLANLVINELACSYIPITKREIVGSVYGKISYDKLSRKALKIKGIYDGDNKLGFVEYPEYIYIEEIGSIIKNVTVEYEYTPNNYGLDEEIAYIEKDIPTRVIAYGVCAEYCISEGLFEQAVLHHKRYIDALSEKFFPKNSLIKKRSWH